MTFAKKQPGPMRIFVLNSGSSSIKYSIFDMQNESRLLSGKIELDARPGSTGFDRRQQTPGVIDQNIESPPVTDHASGLLQIFELLQDKEPDSGKLFHAIGHRVVHGGESFHMPALIDDTSIAAIRKMIPLAPLHNPASLIGIEEMHRRFPNIVQVAVFDTAFFRTLPPRAYRYALPDELYRKHHVRRYGFHGISHQYVAGEVASHLKQPLESLRIISVHLGNGASAAAIQDGICIDTSMGMTPTEGLVMGTRCGDLDPSLHFYLTRSLGMSIDEVESMLNHDSGLKGLCGFHDMREVQRMSNEGNEHARLAIDIYCYRACKYIGAYFTVLGGLDVLAFTGGIGENDAVIRKTICDKLSATGLSLDQERNLSHPAGTFSINKDDCKIKVLVVPANEELEIARQTYSLLNKTSG
jgi:acetate kinase